MKINLWAWRLLVPITILVSYVPGAAGIVDLPALSETQKPEGSLVDATGIVTSRFALLLQLYLPSFRRDF
ncbi:MAG: hypothetical protein WC975_13460 [Phycisphaerae bacterium]